MVNRRFDLPASKTPTKWLNIVADMPTKPRAPLNPATNEPIAPEDLAPLFPIGLIEQEVSDKSLIDIPLPVLDILSLWRPTPLFRARNLEKALETPAKIYYKYEGGSPSGSHKSNTAIAQAYYNKEAGVKRIVTETGAGQWGSAISFACQKFQLETLVYMVKISYVQKPYRRSMIRVWGGDLIPSPSDTTNAGRAILEQDPDSTGSLGIAISEAVEVAANDKTTNYTLGSVLNHVLLHQSVIGLEAKEQMELAGDYPDVIIGCAGGGSNLAGLIAPFVRDKVNGKDIDIIGVEPASCPTMTKGEFAYDFGDTAKMTPLIATHTLGHDFIPPGIHSGGLRYHAMAPIISQLLVDNLMRANSYPQLECFQAATLFAQTEGIIPAPESSHAIREAIVNGLIAKEEQKERVILFNLSGHGHFDMSAYDAFLDNRLTNEQMDDKMLKDALLAIKDLPKISE
ncbi:MAG: TrpB-like pyridoxal phosphate-dependent enzyme [Nitrospinota bacterium]